MRKRERKWERKRVREMYRKRERKLRERSGEESGRIFYLKIKTCKIQISISVKDASVLNEKV